MCIYPEDIYIRPGRQVYPAEAYTEGCRTQESTGEWQDKRYKSVIHEDSGLVITEHSVQEAMGVVDALSLVNSID